MRRTCVLRAVATGTVLVALGGVVATGCGDEQRAGFAPGTDSNADAAAGGPRADPAHGARHDGGSRGSDRDASAGPAGDAEAGGGPARPPASAQPECERCFEVPVAYPLSFAPGDIAVADFDDDGRLDVALQHSTGGADALVSLMLADASGYREVGPFEVGDGANAVVAGDFDGDGSVDVATSNYADGENSVSVLAGDGEGGFAPAIRVDTAGRPFHLAAGDFDGDGRDDLVTANFASEKLGITRGRADRDFRSAVVGPLGLAPTRVCVGDVDGDAKLDALGGFEATSRNLTWFRGDGLGGFLPGDVLDTAGSTAWGCVLGDFDGNGDVDVAVAKRSDDRIAVLRAVDGAFVLEGGLDVLDGPYEVAAADFNRDGIDDLVVSHDRDDVLLVLYGGPDLVTDFLSMSETLFRASERISVSSPVDVIAADMNDDGRPDIVTASVLTRELVVIEAR